MTCKPVQDTKEVHSKKGGNHLAHRRTVYRFVVGDSSSGIRRRTPSVSTIHSSCSVPDRLYVPVLSLFLGKKSSPSNIMSMSTTFAFICLHGPGTLGTCPAVVLLSPVYRRCTHGPLRVWCDVGSSKYRPSIRVRESLPFRIKIHQGFKGEGVYVRNIVAEGSSHPRLRFDVCS